MKCMTVERVEAFIAGLYVIRYLFSLLNLDKMHSVQLFFTNDPCNGRSSASEEEESKRQFVLVSTEWRCTQLDLYCPPPCLKLHWYFACNLRQNGKMKWISRRPKRTLTYKDLTTTKRWKQQKFLTSFHNPAKHLFTITFELLLPMPLSKDRRNLSCRMSSLFRSLNACPLSLQ